MPFGRLMVSPFSPWRYRRSHQPDHWPLDVRGKATRVPVVTFLQVSADMVDSNNVPDGHGHTFHADIAKRASAQIAKIPAETRFNHAQPFASAKGLFILAFDPNTFEETPP